MTSEKLNDFETSKSFENFEHLLKNPISIASRAIECGPRFLNWRWQMRQQIKSRADMEKWQLKLIGAENFEVTEEIFEVGITPYYALLMGQEIDDPIRVQALPQTFELIDALGVRDPLREVDHSTVPEVVHVYPDRVAFCVAQLCPVYCRYCFRKRRDEVAGLHFNRGIIERGVDYIQRNPAIRDVLITGGDPFIASDEAIDQLLEKIRAIPHVEIIRFGTRTPVTLPYRITDNLVKILAKYHPIFVNTHFNCVEELTPDAQCAVLKLVDAGIPVGNQSVLLRHVNDTYEKMLALLRGLLKVRIRPYYLFHPHAVEGTAHLRVSLTVGLEIMRRLRGTITGLGIPSYIIDTPSGKVPILPDYQLSRDKQDLILVNPRGEIHREFGAFDSFTD